MKTPMVHAFSNAPTTDIQRSKFDRSSNYKTTFNAGLLIPFYVDEVLPGDTFDVNATMMVRETTQIVPIMDNLYLTTFFFFVPNRLTWNHWQNFCGEQEDPGDSIDYLLPVITSPSGGFGVESIADYFGIPSNVAGIKVNALPFRAYNLIWNEWFRSEDLQDSVKVVKGDTGDVASDYSLLRRGKRYDYFTSALPYPQKGPGVELPLGTSAPVIGSSPIKFAPYNSTAGTSLSSRNLLANTSFPATSGGGANAVVVSNTDFASGTTYQLRYAEGLQVDLTNATAATINSLRQAFTLQAFYEVWARSGSRYREVIRAFFHVEPQDKRMQIPEYLGGSCTMINSTPVVQNSSTDSTTPQANLAAYTVSLSDRHGFVKSFVEHGYVLGLMCIDADLTYQQGLDRMWSRSTMFDFYWPTFAHLGEQAVLNKEIYLQADSVVDSEGDVVNNKVFGYQERYAEYRYKNSLITGKMRSGVDGSLDVWHLSQYFESLPTLNSSFIQSNPPVERSLAVQDEPQFFADIYISNMCIRPMPLYGTPAVIGGHF